MSAGANSRRRIEHLEVQVAALQARVAALEANRQPIVRAVSAVDTGKSLLPRDALGIRT